MNVSEFSFYEAFVQVGEGNGEAVPAVACPDMENLGARLNSAVSVPCVTVADVSNSSLFF